MRGTDMSGDEWFREFVRVLGPVTERKAALLLDVLGPLHRPAVADPSWLTEAVTALATAIYAERRFDRLPILADALEEAGCDDPGILAHCRGDGPHARGCWVVDLILREVDPVV